MLINLLCSCGDRSPFLKVDDSLKNIVDLGIQQQKYSLILVSEPLLDDSFYTQISQIDKDSFICYKANSSQKKIFEKILGIDIKLPTCITILADSILNITVYLQGKTLQISNVADANEASMFFHVGDKKMLSKDINDTFRKRYLFEKIDRKESVDIFEITYPILTSFYNKYLTACLLQYMKKYDEANVILNDLWKGFTLMEEVLYKEELIDIMVRRSILPSINADDIEFESKHYDFGKVHSNSKLTHSFIFRNKSNYKMMVSDVKTSCGCTQVLWNKDVISSGQIDSIVVTLRTNQRGFIMKDISVGSNCDATIKLKISATVIDY